jgi:hypothetical protein
MNANRKTALYARVFFLLATVLSLIGSTLIGSVINTPHYLTTVAAHGKRMILSTITQCLRE